MLLAVTRHLFDLSCQARRLEMEAEHKHQDELKHQAEAAKEAERKAKYELALAREEERKMVSERNI
jgi:hypothetical protein